MIVGLDIGYSHVKLVGDQKRIRFASTVGNWEQEHFSLDMAAELGAGAHQQKEPLVLRVDEVTWMIGEEAVLQSRFLFRREDRDWISSSEYNLLYLAALTQLTTASGPSLQIVTGLPVNYFGDREKLEDHLHGDHQAQLLGRRRQTFKVEQVQVIPQPFGALLSRVLNEQGEVVDTDLATGRVGIIDIGGKTTGFLVVDNLREIPKETTAIPTGCWDPIRVIGETINDRFTGLDLSSHEVIHATVDGAVKYFGKQHDITQVVESALEPLITMIVDETTQRWNGGARLDAVLITGGGAFLIGETLGKHFPHAQIVDDPVFANAEGFYRWGNRLWRQ
ncbi:ParM/StbA family protein [Chloroflexi bacterium TSY]|nr:ParM/StbA family protein [Chloroflexi bacterium TSY]